MRSNKIEVSEDSPSPSAELSNYGIAQELATRLEALGFEPYRSDRSRFIYIPGQDGNESEWIERGRPLKGGRFFWTNAARDAAILVEEFSEFSRKVGLDNCYFWNVSTPVRKASLDHLEAELESFNRKINNVFSELRKKNRFEQLVLAVHFRYDEFSDCLDLHAHFVCRVPPDQLEEVRNVLRCAFSKPDLDLAPIKNPAAVLNYMLYGILKNREMLDWPDHALAAVWRLTQNARYRYVRTGGGFAKFRRGLRPTNDNVAARDKRVKVTPRDPEQPRFLARISIKRGGKRIPALLFEYPASQPVGGSGMCSTANRATTQEPKTNEARFANENQQQASRSRVSDTLKAVSRASIGAIKRSFGGIFSKLVSKAKLLSRRLRI